MIQESAIRVWWKYPQVRKLKCKEVGEKVFITRSILSLEPNLWTGSKNSKMAVNHLGASQVTQGGKEPACNAGDTRVMGSIPGLGRSPRGGHGNPLQYSYLKNPMDRRAWWATVHRWQRVRHDWCDWEQPSTNHPELNVHLSLRILWLCQWLAG